MDAKELLAKAGIEVKDGQVALSDLDKVMDVLEPHVAQAADDDDDFDPDDMAFDELKDKADIKEDGLGVLNLYMEKFHKDAEGPTALVSALEDFVSDVEEYAMDAVQDMLAYLNEEKWKEEKED